MQTLTDLLPLWIADLTLEGRRKSGVDSYAANFRRFLRFLRKDVSEPTAADFSEMMLRRFLLEINHLHSATINSHFCGLRHFGDWLQGRNLRADNPARLVKLPRRGRDATTRRLADETDIAKFLAAVHLLPKQQRFFYRAVCYVLVTTGLRRQEILDIKVGDVDLAQQKLTVAHGKGNKKRVVYLADSTCQYLTEWLEQRTAMQCRHDWLWAADRGRRMGTGKLDTIRETVCEMAGLGKDANILNHAMRHAYATRLLNAPDSDLKTIQMALGHSSMMTTMRYLHSNEGKLKSLRNAGSISVEMPHPSETLEFADNTLLVPVPITPQAAADTAARPSKPQRTATKEKTKAKKQASASSATQNARPQEKPSETGRFHVERFAVKTTSSPPPRRRVNLRDKR